MSMTSNSVVFKIVLPIIVGLAIFATLDSIKVNSLDNQTDNLGDALSQFNRQITLGGDGEQKARDKYREAAVFNVLGAQHCGLVGKPEEAEVSREYEDFMSKDGIGTGSVISQLETSSADEVFGQETDQESVIYFPGDSKPYETLREDDELLTCAGADQLSSSIPGVSAITEGEGNDMEGRYGRINFEAEETITLENPDVASFSFPDINHEGTYPNMLAGLKRTAMVPAGCDSEERYDGRMKMENVPAIMEGDLIGQYDLCDFNEFNQMLEDHENPIQYKICEGATGYIQSNVGDSYNTGEATTSVSGRSFVAGIIEIYGGITGVTGTEGLIQEKFMNLEVYPMTLIRQNSMDCLNNDYETGQGLYPALELDSGDRDTCDLEDAVSGTDSVKYWNNGNVPVECGLTEARGQADNVYTSGWILDQDRSCNEIRSYEIKASFRQIDQNNGEVSWDGTNAEIVNTGDIGSSATARYGLSHFEEVDTVEVELSGFGDDIGEAYKVHFRNGETKEYRPDAQTVGSYNLYFDFEDGEIRSDVQSNDQMEYSDVESIDIEGSSSGTGKIESVYVRGELRGCS